MAGYQESRMTWHLKKLGFFPESGNVGTLEDKCD